MLDIATREAIMEDFGTLSMVEMVEVTETMVTPVLVFLRSLMMPCLSSRCDFTTVPVSITMSLPGLGSTDRISPRFSLYRPVGLRCQKLATRIGE